MGFQRGRKLRVRVRVRVRVGEWLTVVIRSIVVSDEAVRVRVPATKTHARLPALLFETRPSLGRDSVTLHSTKLSPWLGSGLGLIRIRELLKVRVRVRAKGS